MSLKIRSEQLRQNNPYKYYGLKRAEFDVDAVRETLSKHEKDIRHALVDVAARKKNLFKNETFNDDLRTALFTDNKKSEERRIREERDQSRLQKAEETRNLKLQKIAQKEESKLEKARVKKEKEATEERNKRAKEAAIVRKQLELERSKQEKALEDLRKDAKKSRIKDLEKNKLAKEKPGREAQKKTRLIHPRLAGALVGVLIIAGISSGISGRQQKESSFSFTTDPNWGKDKVAAVNPIPESTSTPVPTIIYNPTFTPEATKTPAAPTNTADVKPTNTPAPTATVIPEATATPTPEVKKYEGIQPVSMKIEGLNEPFEMSLMPMANDPETGIIDPPHIANVAGFLQNVTIPKNIDNPDAGKTFIWTEPGQDGKKAHIEAHVDHAPDKDHPLPYALTPWKLLKLVNPGEFLGPYAQKDLIDYKNKDVIMYLTDAKGKTLKFKVVNTKVVTRDEFYNGKNPKNAEVQQLMYGPFADGIPGLSFSTCIGNYINGDYDRRFIVELRLIL